MCKNVAYICASYTHVCVCVCVERERDRERGGGQKLHVLSITFVGIPLDLVKNSSVQK